MRSAALAAAVLVLLGGTLVARAQQPKAAPEETTVMMDYQDMELADVIKQVALFSGKNFLYDERVRGKVTVISETPISRDEAYRVFEAILHVKGFTTVEGPGGITKIIPVRDAKESPIDTVTGEVFTPNRDLFITRLMPLKYVKAETIANTFRPLVSKEANVIAYAPTNTLILTDTSANIRRLMTVLAEIDVKTYQDQIKVIPIEFADAGALAQQLAEIFSEGQAQPVTRRRATRARAQRTGAQQAAAEAQAAIFGATGQPRFITDDRTNSIIVIAPASTIRQVQKLVTLLDYQRKGSGRIHVYRLQNADAEEMAQTLSTLSTGSGTRTQRPTATATGAVATPVSTSAVAQLEGGVRITADAPTNSLIIQASAEGFAALRDVIQDLDTRRPQVMVESLIMEVDVTDGQDLGFGLLYQNILEPSRPDSRLTVGTLTASGTRDFDPSGDTNPGAFLTRIIGKTVTVLDPDGNPIDVPVIQGLLVALGSEANTNIVSAPTILTADNEEAQIVIGQNIPIPTSRLQTDSSSPDNAFQTSQNITRQDVGVTLRVTPQISEGESVRLEIFQEISEVLAEESGETGSLGPVTTNRQVENTVYVKDGEAVMIGGILTDTRTDSVSKVPWLGDIPILGWLFKSTGWDVRKINLLVVLTPHIVRDPEDLEKLTTEQREKFRDAAGDTLRRTEEEEEARRKALEAGISLPDDPNPVRRELEALTERYPTEEFPLLEESRAARERERIRAMEEVARRAGGDYRVQVSLFRTADEAAALLQLLMTLGYDGTVLSRDEAGQTVHMVQLGPYITEDRGQQVAREVRAETGLQAYVIVEP